MNVVNFPAFKEIAMKSLALCYKPVRCKACGREYVCTPNDDYYNCTTSTDGVCLKCLMESNEAKTVVIVSRPNN